jgi:hypothetical protein
MKKRYVHKNVNLLFYILFTVAGIIGSVCMSEIRETEFFTGIPLSIFTYSIFFLGLILTIYYYWDIVFPSEILVKMIYGIFFTIWIILVLYFAFIVTYFYCGNIFFLNLFIISPIIIMMVILAKYIK